MQQERINALRDAIEEANTRETYGLYNLNNTIVRAEDLETLTEALNLLEAGFNLKTYLLTAGQKKLLKAYEIDITKGKTITTKNLEEMQKTKGN